ncbi:MAG TPA: MEDS domain-containing protein [Candidatus Dormibacteraeota bacterium]
MNGGSEARMARGGKLRLSQHVHAGHIYETQEEQLGLTAALFRASLDEGLCCVYMHDYRDNDAAAQALARTGLDVIGALGSAALQLVPAAPAAPGEFDAEAVLRFVHELAREAEAAGYEGTRGVGDMAWTIPSDPSHERLIHYEMLVTGAMHSLASAVICQYDRGRFRDPALFDVVCAHPWLVIEGIVCQNPYYVPEGSFSERDRGSLDLDHALGNVLARERQERWLAVAESDLETHGDDATSVDVSRLASIYEHMRDYKRALRDRLQSRVEPLQRASAARRELAALDGEIEWLEQRSSFWRRRELQSFGLVLDAVSGTLVYRSRAVGLSRLEVALFRVLLEQAGRPIHAGQLIRIAWEREVRTEAQLRNYIVRLRGKLETLRAPASIETVRGRGYRLVTNVEPPPVSN